MSISTVQPGVSASAVRVKDTWLGTARGRLGYAGWNNWLPYITGGGAFGNIKVSTPFGDNSNTKWGWTAGAGLEWAFLAELECQGRISLCRSRLDQLQPVRRHPDEHRL